MRKALFLLLFLSQASLVTSQNYWKKIESSSKLTKKTPPKEKSIDQLNLFTLKTESFKTELTQKSASIAENIIILPNDNGTFSKFKVSKKIIFENVLTKKFPEIKSYTAKGIDDPSAVANISSGTDGIHVMITSNLHKTLYIDPYSKDQKTYKFYKKSDISSRNKQFECEVKEIGNRVISNNKKRARIANDGQLRTFRLALACTGEYSQFHLNNQNIPSNSSDQIKKAAVLSAMNTTITRVNGVFERDLGVRFILVGNNDSIIFLNAATDQLSNDDANNLIDESQTVCDNNIGAANYDIGHTFSTGGGGLAGLGVVCINNHKARGITGSSSPIGDAYDIDYVAHEVGHQFGAHHTFNNACGGQRSSSASVEVGSGSTIMSYAGICQPNVANNSNDYFHAVSITQMWQNIQSSATCASVTNTNNSPPTANAGSDMSIPKSTPFILKGQATDANGTSSLTYNWEQIDNEVAVMPPVETNTAGPLFRSLPSKTVPERYFPDFATVIAGNTASTWEVLPSVARDMNFSFTVRDNHPGGGAVARDDIKITVTDSPAFIVTNQATWAQNTSRDITWSVGQSNVAPINCQTVNIKLSTDGGTTFAVNLALNTANDGSETITLPNNIADTENAIILIEAVDNIFYNVSSKFTVSSSPSFAITNTTGDAVVCNTIMNEQNFNITYVTSNGFNENVNFSLNGVPTGATGTVTPNPLSSNGTVTINITDLKAVTPGNYPITLQANGSSLSKSLTFNLNVLSEICSSSGNTDYNTSTTLVKFNTINNATPNKTSGYHDYTAITTNVVQGQTYQLTVNTNTDDTATQEFSTLTTAWIDWNHNCQLDPDEKLDLGLVTGSADGQTSLSPLSVTVPNDARTGNTLLRVSTKFAGDGDPTSCETDFDGEVEDYHLIVDATASTLDTAFENFSLYPNPSNGNFTLNFRTKSGNVFIKLFDLSGRLIESLEYKNTSSTFTKNISSRAVSSGLYLIHIKNGDTETTQKLLIK